MTTNRPINSINIGLLGFGNVGSGAARALVEHRNEIRQRFDGELFIKAVCSPKIAERDTSFLDAATIRTTDPAVILQDPEIDIVVEAIGGREPANSYLLQAIEAGKAIVTANKLLLATDGPTLARAAVARGVGMGIEAAVAGGIPVLNAIREGLAGERIESIYGILNGTTNFILTEMEKSGRPFHEMLATAQQLGYAEADPTLDIEGFDARDKLAILAMLCFGYAVEPTAISTTGITRLRSADFIYANHIGYTIKLLCAARIIDGRLAISVGPALVPHSSMLAKVDGSFNAVLVNGAAGGRTMYYGRGAGAGPTGIAIASDIIRIARERRAGVANLSQPFSFRELIPQSPAPQSSALASAAIFPYLVRFVVHDRPGIVAQLAGILAKYQIDIDAVLQQKTFQQKEQMPFVITLEAAPEDRVMQALSEMSSLDFLIEPPLALRIEDLA